MFRIIYILFFISSLLYGTTYVTIIGMTPRQVFAALMFFMCLYKERKIVSNKILFAYFIFVFSWGVTSIVNNYEANFLHDVFAYHFVALVMWKATQIVVKDKSFIIVIINTILLIGFFDVIVTLLQFFNNNAYEFFMTLLALPLNETFVENTENFRDIVSVSIPGIMGDPVTNGYYLSLCVSFSFVHLIRKRKLYLIILPFYFLIGTFVCQQRSAFFVSLIVAAVLTFKIFLRKIKGGGVLLFFVLIGFVIYFYQDIYSFSNINELRYSSKGMADQLRLDIYNNAKEYISFHIFNANIYEFRSLYLYSPHNLFFNAFIYGGIISFVAIMYILYVQLKNIYYVLRKRQSVVDPIFVIIGWSFITYLLNSLTHNSSIVTGDYLVWCIWGMLPDMTTKERI